MEIGAVPFSEKLPPDYRTFLGQLFLNKKRVNRRFSMRRFAEIAGFKSPNYLQLILNGTRSLSLPMGEQIAERFKLPASQKEYFLALLKTDLAKNETERLQAERLRLAALKKILSKQIPEAQTEVLSRWYHLAVRELFLIPKASADPKWLARMLAGCITEDQAAESVELLLRSGFLAPEGSSFKVVDPVICSDEDSLQAAFMQQHHAELLATWSKNLDRLDQKEQELGVLNIPLNSDKLPELRRRIRQFQDEIVAWVQSETQADRVVQMGTYLIPFCRQEDAE